MLLSQIFLFKNFINENKKEITIPKDLSDAEVFLSLFEMLKIKNAYIAESNNGLEFVYSNYGIVIDNNLNSIVVHNYNDSELPIKKEDVKEKIILSNKNIEEFVEYKRKNIFSLDYGRRVRNVSI